MLWVVLFFLITLVEAAPTPKIGPDASVVCAMLRTIQGLNQIWGYPRCSPNLDRDYCPFYGITCNRTTLRINALYLDSRIPSGSLPIEIGSLSGLTHLYIYNTKLTGPIPTHIGQLLALTRFYLDNNEMLQSTLPATIANLRNLNHFYSYRTGLLSLPNTLGSLVSLTYFYVSEAPQLTGTIPGDLVRLPKLAHFHLGGCPLLSGTIPAGLGRISTLTSFVLYSCAVSGTIPAALFTPPNITTISISSTLVSGSIPISTGKVTKLSSLLLYSNQLSFPIPPEIRNLNALTRLQLYSNRINGTIPTQIATLTLLGELYLSNNPLEGTLPEDLWKLGQLTNLIIQKTKISGTIPNYYKYLPLNALQLGSNQLTGSIPTNLAYSLTDLRLHENEFTGTVPSLQRYAQLSFVFLYGNQLKGVPVISGMTRLRQILIFDNILQGISVKELRLLELLIYEPQRQFCSEEVLCSIPQTICGPNAQCICGSGYEFNLNKTACVDVDECLTGLWQSRRSLNTNASCREREQCINRVGGFECCPSGYEANSRGTACIDVDECIRGTWISLNSFNTKAPCVSRSKCLNLIGSFFCCGSGFEANNAGTECVDIDECARGLWNTLPSGNTRAPCDSKIRCVNKNGTFWCCSRGYQANINGTGCEDTDECSNGQWQTLKSRNTKKPCLSLSQCVNTRGNFTCCDRGFISNGTDCVDIDECTTGQWSSLRSNNTNRSCTARYECVNTNGSFICCLPGFQADLINGTDCEDINECVPGARIQHQCDTLPDTYCSNTIGNYTCNPCDGAGIVEVDEEKKDLFRSLAKYSSTIFRFKTCFGPCESGIHVTTYRDEAVPCSGRRIDFTKMLCSYACKNLTSRNTGQTAIEALSAELQRGGFLEDILLKIFNISVHFPTKRVVPNVLRFSFTPCVPKMVSPIKALLASLMNEITPHAPNPVLQISPSCSVSIVSTDNEAKTNPFNLPLVIGLVLGAGALVILLISVLIYYYWSDELKHLPDDVSWCYRQYKLNPFSWSFHGSSKSGYHYKDLDPKSEFYLKAMKLLNHLHLGRNEKLVKGITAVYNPVLIRNFVGNYQINLSRMGRKEFKKRFAASDPQRKFVMDRFQSLCGQYDFNKDSGCPIVPLAHGTDLLIAEKICENGFAALSSLDAGYFGKGIYFTSYLMYTLRYLVPRSRPAIIVSWVIPGNVYPVTEGHKSENSLLGSALKSGHSSHYVLTTRDGDCINDSDPPEYFDELVVSQESQITPAFIFHIDPVPLPGLFTLWSKGKHRMSVLIPNVVKEEDPLVSLSASDATSLL